MAPKPKGVDDFVLENVYSFAQSKTKIFLDPFRMSSVDEAFQELIFYGLSKTEEIPNDKTNIFRADLFSLFPNVVEVELWTDGYPLNLLSLLSVLNEADIPPSFQRIRIMDELNWWIEGAVSAVPDVEEQFAAKGFLFETETVKDAKWINIQKQ